MFIYYNYNFLFKKWGNMYHRRDTTRKMFFYNGYFGYSTSVINHRCRQRRRKFLLNFLRQFPKKPSKKNVSF